MSAPCPSQLTLDRKEAGELPLEEARAIELHAAGCARCKAGLAERSQGFAAFAQVDERKVLAGIRRGLEEKRDRPGKLGKLGTALLALASIAVAAGALLIVPRRAPEASEATAPSGLRAKGSGLALRIFRQSPGGSEEMQSAARFEAGDRLRFVVDLPSDGFVRILDVERDGALQVAWPLLPGVSGQLAAGSEVTLPGAVQLDGKQGRETFYLVHCPLAGGAPLCVRGDPQPACPAGCALAAFVVDKSR